MDRNNTNPRRGVSSNLARPLPGIPPTTNPAHPIQNAQKITERSPLYASSGKVVPPKTQPRSDSSSKSLSDDDDVHEYDYIESEKLKLPNKPISPNKPLILKKPAMPDPVDASQPFEYGNFNEFTHVNDQVACSSLSLDMHSVYDDGCTVVPKTTNAAVGSDITDQYQDVVGQTFIPTRFIPNLKKIVRKNETWPGPLLLVDNSYSGTFSVVQSTIKKLKEITGPVVVVSIVGPYRTGKSFLMNKIFNKRKGFEADSSVQAKTMGIWVWSHEPLVDQGPQMLLLDTEGLGDARKVCGGENDINIFVLTCLLSTCMIYNSRGIIDQPAIDNLKFVTEISSKLSIFSEADNANSNDALLGLYFPQLLWVIRDFVRDLKGMTPDEYLEDILALRPGINKGVQKYNATRQCITTYFPNRKCFVFPHPVRDFDYYTDVKTLREFAITGDFSTALEQLTEVIRKAKPKNFNGTAADGQLFACLVEQFASSLAENKVPNIEIALSRAVRKSNDELLKVCLQKYKESMNQLELPTADNEILLRHHNKYFNEALEFIDMYYKTNDVKQDENFQTQLKEELESNFSEIRIRNEEISIKKCKQVLEVCMSDVMTKVEGKVYMEARGYKRYQDDFNNAEKKYRQEPGKGLMETTVLLEFKKEMSATAKAILEVDTALKKQEKENIASSHMEQMYALHKEEEIRQEVQKKYKNEFRRKYDIMKSNIQAKFEEKEDRLVVDAEFLMKLLKIETEKLNVVGCKENAKFLGEVLSNLEDAVHTAKEDQTNKKAKKSFRTPGFLKLLKKRQSHESDDDS